MGLQNIFWATAYFANEGVNQILRFSPTRTYQYIKELHTCTGEKCVWLEYFTNSSTQYHPTKLNMCMRPLLPEHKFPHIRFVWISPFREIRVSSSNSALHKANKIRFTLPNQSSRGILDLSHRDKLLQTTPLYQANQKSIYRSINNSWNPKHGN